MGEAGNGFPPMFAGSTAARIPAEFGAAALRAPLQGAACTVPPREDAQPHPKAPGFPWQLPEHPACCCGAGRGAQHRPRWGGTFWHHSPAPCNLGQPFRGAALPGAGSDFGHGAVPAALSAARGALRFACLPSGLVKRARMPAWLLQAKGKKNIFFCPSPSPSQLGSRKLPLSSGRSVPSACQRPARPEAPKQGW